jgi:hypothetical protein
LIKNLIAFIASLVFSIAAKIMLLDLVKAYHLPTFLTLSVAIFSSYMLMMLSILHNLIAKSKRRK